MQIKIKAPGKFIILLLLSPVAMFAQGKHKLKTIAKVYAAALIRLAFRTNINGWHGFLNVFGWAYGYFELSDVLLSKNKRKAIVEINHHIERSGAGCIFLLEKKKRKWIVGNWMQTWIA